jgi:hypothetical protein
MASKRPAEQEEWIPNLNPEFILVLCCDGEEKRVYFRNHNTVDEVRQACRKLFCLTAFGVEFEGRSGCQLERSKTLAEMGAFGGQRVVVVAASDTEMASE